LLDCTDAVYGFANVFRAHSRNVAGMFLPFLFERTASHCIRQLHERMVVHRAALQQASLRGRLD
jgi:hypothetical protein